MEQADYDQVRSIALTLKKRCDELYEELAPIHKAAHAWILNSADDALPTAGQVKMQVEAFEAMRKHPLRLSRDVVILKNATSELTPTGEPLRFDGSIEFDGTEKFTGETQE